MILYVVVFGNEELHQGMSVAHLHTLMLHPGQLPLLQTRIEHTSGAAGPPTDLSIKPKCPYVATSDTPTSLWDIHGWGVLPNGRGTEAVS